MSRGRVHLGYFADFKSSDTILLEGDTDGLRLLTKVFHSLGTSEDAVAIDTLPFVEVHQGVRLIATVGTRDVGARRGDSPMEFRWDRTRSSWQDAADMLSVLSGSLEGHQYLQATDDEVTVQVSLGEYGDNWWREHG